MNQYITGSLIKQLREKKKMTQAELAKKLNISDKTVSKWETAKGYPDITMLEAISNALEVSIASLVSGTATENKNISANMQKTKFYICPICSNIIHSVGDATISCHGITLFPLESDLPDKQHQINIEIIDDEYYVTINHEMSKNHYISFICAVSDNSVQLTKLYPESNAEARYKISRVKAIYYYCNNDGLYKYNIKKAQTI